MGWGVRGRGSRLVVVEVEDVLLEVADPVLLHRERTLELHLTEPAPEGVDLSHHFDQGRGRGFGHQGRNGASARGLGGATVPLSSL